MLLLTALPFTGASAISNSFRELAHIKYATGTRNSCRFLGTQRVYCYWQHSREGTPLSSQGLRRWRGVFARRPLKKPGRIVFPTTVNRQCYGVMNITPTGCSKFNSEAERVLSMYLLRKGAHHSKLGRNDLTSRLTYRR